MSKKKDEEFKPDWASPPGDTIRDVMAAKNMLTSELVKATGFSIYEVERVLVGEYAITPEFADALERVLGTPATFWLAREEQYQQDLKRLGKERPRTCCCPCGGCGD